MIMSAAMERRITLGDPVPWFSAVSIAGAPIDLHVAAGRWVVLAFLGALDAPQALGELGALVSQAALLSEDRVVVYGVVTAPPPNLAALSVMISPVLNFIADYDGSISARYGARGAPRTIVLDPMLRAVADIGWDHAAGHA